MKNKTFILMSAFLLTATLLMCFTSAGLTISGNAQFTTGTEYQSFTVTNTNDTDVADVIFTIPNINNTNFKILLENASGIDVTAGTSITNNSYKTFVITPSPKINYSKYKLKEGYSGDFIVKESTVPTNNATLNMRIENTDPCYYELPKTDLEIKLEDPTVTGFGDEWDMYPLDKAEINVEFDNKNRNYELTDIEFKWGIYDKDTLSWFIEEDENEFDLEEKEDVVETVNINLNEDFDDLEDGNYIFYVWADAVLDDKTIDGKKICVSDSKNIDFQFERNFVVLKNIEAPATTECNQDLTLKATLWNIGKKEQEEFHVRLKNSELGINEEIDIEKLKPYKSQDVEFSIAIPRNAYEKNYDLVFSVYDKNNELYDDGDDDFSKYTEVLSVAGNCIKNEAKVLVYDTEMITEEALENEEVVIETSIANEGNIKGTFKLSAEGYSDWAESVTFDKTSLILDTGKSERVTMTFKVLEDVDKGEYNFTMNVLGSNGVTNAPMSLEVGKKGSAKVVVGIVLLSIVLIVAIVVVIFKIADKK
jgi:hypothetical protein